jgi:DNA repair exonuclease SbcCD ATPase subunit
MIKNLDDRIADLNAKRRSSDRDSAYDDKHAVNRIYADAQNTSLLIENLVARTDIIDDRALNLEQRLQKLWVVAAVGFSVAVIIAMSVIFFGLWAGTRIKLEAENEATHLRETYASEVATAREEGEAELARLRADLSEQADKTAAEIIGLEANLDTIIEKRETVRQELEHFITLRERIAIQLVEFQGQTLIVLPEGARLRRWKATDSPEMAHLNGRMYRLSN